MDATAQALARAGQFPLGLIGRRIAEVWTDEEDKGKLRWEGTVMAVGLSSTGYWHYLVLLDGGKLVDVVHEESSLSELVLIS